MRQFGILAHSLEGAMHRSTEIPLQVAPEDSRLPTLDATRLLVRAAFAVALGREPLPR